MKNMLVMLFVLVIAVAGFGYYRGWFSAETSSTDHKANVNLSVNRDKIQEDINSVKKRSGTDPK